MGISIDWDGKGLPPVGWHGDGLIRYGASTQWRECEILKQRNGEAAVLVDNPGFLAWCKEFRTPEQREREELSAAVNEALSLGLNHRGVANLVWVRGFRKVKS